MPYLFLWSILSGGRDLDGYGSYDRRDGERNFGSRLLVDKRLVRFQAEPLTLS
ncbi:MAG TPA: hypothetical protein VD738_04595 [Nitrospira sp.]|jgi:hypothetical protein|nr:hypothetical protein [Nitrospira sp.]